MPVPLSTAVVEVYDNEDETTTTHYAKNVQWLESSLVWTDADMDEDNADRVYPYLSLEDGGDHVRLITASGTIRVRSLGPYDGVKRSPAGVPQPLEVLQAEVLRGGGVVAQELDAVVAPDNTVATLLLETGLGIYVRYSGDWQLLSPDSAALDDTYLLPVGPEAIEVFDTADRARTTLSAFDLPRVEHLEGGASVQILPEPVGVQAEMPETGGTMIASGTMIPTVDTVGDLDVAVKIGMNNPNSRWYIAKRAAALGAEDHVPAEWLPRTVMRPFLPR